MKYGKTDYNYVIHKYNVLTGATITSSSFNVYPTQSVHADGLLFAFLVGAGAWWVFWSSFLQKWQWIQ